MAGGVRWTVCGFAPESAWIMPIQVLHGLEFSVGIGEVVVILGANHQGPPFRGVSVFLGSGYRTPLGLAPIDREIAPN